MVHVKGTAIRGALKYVKESSHPGGIPALLAELPEDARAALAQRVLASQWVPYPAYAALLAAIDRRLGRGDLSLMHELGVWLARQDVGTTFKIVAVFASVETVLQRSMLFWSRHCDHGSFETVVAERGRAVGRLSGVPGIAREHCHLFTGWIQGIGEAAGAQRVEVTKTRCVHRGDPWCEYAGTWV